MVIIYLILELSRKKLKIEKSILVKDFKSISEYLSNENQTGNGNGNLGQSEKNKYFLTLLTQMKKATRIISMLEKLQNI